MTITTGRPRSRARRNPAPFILGAVAVVLIVYYLIVAFSGVLQASTAVPISGPNEPDGEDYVTLRMSTQDIDLTNRIIQANVLPIPAGDLAGDQPGEFAEGLRIEVNSGGVTTTVVAVPGESIIDPTSVALTLERGDTDYPFDRPFADFRLSVENEQTGRAVPFVLELSNSARPWILNGVRRDPVDEGGATLVPINIEGGRDALTVTLVLFYVLAILLTTLMAVVIIGSAILRRRLEFANVIWLSATLLSFPALRSAMPGAPPIGTALDFIVLFPCLCLIAAMLVWTGGYLLWRESHVLRRRSLDDEQAAASASAPAPADAE